MVVTPSEATITVKELYEIEALCRRLLPVVEGHDFEPEDIAAVKRVEALAKTLHIMEYSVLPYVIPGGITQ